MSAYVSLSREVPNLSLHRLSGPVMFGHEANDSASKPAAGDLSFNVHGIQLQNTQEMDTYMVV
jgi:hypothetical protein